MLFQVLSFVRAWADAQVDWRLQTEIRQRVHDHLQSLSLEDFFTGARSGALMQRVQIKYSGVQKLLTDCLIPPFIDSVVLLVAVGYLLSLSWQMTIVSLILAPLALVALRVRRQEGPGTQMRMMTQNRELGGELEETISGISDIQIFNAQGRRSQRFRAASGSAAKSSAMMIVWLQASQQGRADVHRPEHGGGADRRRGVRCKLRAHGEHPDRIRRIRADDVRARPADHRCLHAVQVQRPDDRFDV